MRLLNDIELDLVAGGFGDSDSTKVTVTGWGPDYSDGDAGYNGSDNGGGSSSESDSNGFSAAANSFADAHVHNLGNTAKDATSAQHVHDQVAKMYDWAHANPNASVYLSHGVTITASQAMQQLDRTTINITDSTGSDVNFTSGAATTCLTGQGATININPQYGNEAGWVAEGDVGLDYSLFHELGHALEWGNNAAETVSSDRESAANTTGRSLENDMNISMPDDSNYPANWYAA